MTKWNLRVPDDLQAWLRAKAAQETIRRNERVSINTLVVEILTKAMKADQKKGGDR
jgi:predicted HicB family RNase H-like nuclease